MEQDAPTATPMPLESCCIMLEKLVAALILSSSISA